MNSSERLFAWTNTSGVMKVNDVLDRYTCVGGCTGCISEYELNKECYHTGMVIVANSTTNSTTTNTTTNTTINTTTNSKTTSNNIIPNNTIIQNNTTIPNPNISIPTV